MTPRPMWTALDLPAPPDPQRANDAALLAGEMMPALEAAHDGAGSSLVEAGGAVGDGLTVATDLGRIMADGAAILETMRAEAEADTLIDAVARALQQDAALASVDSNIGDIADKVLSQPDIPATLPGT